MSVTCGAMIDETIGLLQSYSTQQEQSTTLQGILGSADLVGNVTTTRGVVTGLTPGVVEIDSELIFVDTVTQTGFTIPPWGRGYRSTVAASHTANSRIVSKPQFPRARVFDYLNQTIQRVYPEVFGVKSYETTTTRPAMTYDLPDTARKVLGVKWLVPDGRNYWKSLLRWRLSPGGGTMFGDQGITVDVDQQGVQSGRPIQFLYAVEPVNFTLESQDFETQTGLSTGLRDVIVTGAAARAAQTLELSRLQTGSIEQQNRSQVVSPGAALTASRYLEGLFQQRLLEERKNLQQLYPPRVTREWV